MADVKQQGHLNGAYYSPPVTPRHRSFCSVGRSCCGCLLCNVFKFLLSLIVTLGVVVLVFWLLSFAPTSSGPALTPPLSSDSTSMALPPPLQPLPRSHSPQPQPAPAFYYDRLETRAEYDRNRLGFAHLPTFYQVHKNTTAIGPILFDGTQRLLRDSVGETYRRETSEGFYYIDVKVRAKMRVKVWIFKLRYNRPHIDCVLKLPVPGSGGAFESTGCDVDMF